MTELKGTEDVTGSPIQGKDDFIGKILDSAVDDEEYQNNEYESDIDLLYEVEPVKILSEEDKEYKIQETRFINISGNPASKWNAFLNHFENVWGTFDENGLEDLEDLTEFLRGKVVKFRDITWAEEDVELEWGPEGEKQSATLAELIDEPGDWNNMLVPYEQVSDEKMAELGVEEGLGLSSSQTEEVDF